MTITSKKQKTNLQGFTIMEILISMSILAIGFAGIFVMMQNSTQITQQTQTKILAINLSREAVEIIHNIRDSNWTKWSGNPESCRLKIDPLVDENNNGCQNDSRMSSGRYIIEEKNIGDQKYFALEEVQIPGLLTQEDAISSRALTQLCQDKLGRSHCPNTESDEATRVIQPTESSIIITRAIHIMGLYNKETTVPGGEVILCENGETNIQIHCGSNHPKELRFCVHTHIIADKSTHIQLCSMLTNFKQ